MKHIGISYKIQDWIVTKSDSRYDVLHGQKRDNHWYLLIIFIISFLIRRSSAVMGYFQTKRGKTTYIWLQFSPESCGITARKVAKCGTSKFANFKTCFGLIISKWPLYCESEMHFWNYVLKINLYLFIVRIFSLLTTWSDPIFFLNLPPNFLCRSLFFLFRG